MPAEQKPNGLTKDQIVSALSSLNDLLVEAHIIGEICLSDGGPCAS